MHTVIAELAFCHGEHIWANLETSARLQENNHYIADLLGLAAVVAAYPNLPKARKWGEYTHNELMRCVRKQVSRRRLLLRAQHPLYTADGRDALLRGQVLC